MCHVYNPVFLVIDLHLAIFKSRIWVECISTPATKICIYPCKHVAISWKNTVLLENKVPLKLKLLPISFYGTKMYQSTDGGFVVGSSLQDIR